MKSLTPGGRPGRGGGGAGTMSGKQAAVGVGTPAPARHGQGDDPLDLRIDGLGQGEGIQLIAQADERSHHLGIRLGAGLDPLERRARRIVTTP